MVAVLDKKRLGDNRLILFHGDNDGVRNAMLSGQMADLFRTLLPCDNGPYREGKGSRFGGGDAQVLVESGAQAITDEGVGS